MPLSFRNIDVLSAEEPGVDGPGTRSEHGQGGTEISQQDVDPQISKYQEDFPHTNGDHQRPRNGRP